MNSLQIAASGWTRALFDRRTHVSVPMGGHTTVDAAWATGRRTLPFDHAVYLVVRHTLSGVVDGHDIEARAGTLLWIPPGIPHALRVGDGRFPFEVWWARLRVLRGEKNVRAPRPLIEPDAWDAVSEMRLLMDALHASGHRRSDRVRSLLVLLGTRPPVRSDGRTPGTVLSQQQRKVIEAVAAESVAARLRPADLAQATGLSEDYFTRLFKRSFGLSPRAWLLRQRIRVAAMRLADSTSTVKNVAQQFGYEDLYLFSRQFKQVMGQSPRAYRRSAGQQSI